MKTGRPKQTENRTRRVNIRFTETEYVQLLKTQEELGTTLAIYLRETALKQKIKSITDLRTLNQVRKIGVNVNQIAKTLNGWNERKLVEDEMLHELRRTTDALRELYSTLKDI